MVMGPAYTDRSTRVNAKTPEAATVPAGPDGAGPDAFRSVSRARLRGRDCAAQRPPSLVSLSFEAAISSAVKGKRCHRFSE